MDKRKVGYWVATGLLVPPFLGGGVFDIMAPPDVIEALNHLGYPGYFARIIGVWKVLAVVALLVPRFPRLKEWAYAGLIFDTTGAAISHAVTGDPAFNVITPLVLAAIAMISWWLRPASRKLASPSEAASAPALRRETATAIA
jgi:uncharacterized membrane protein YphA (DoxX/SURF4 family)